jgi:hypothetical protein
LTPPPLTIAHVCCHPRAMATAAETPGGGERSEERKKKKESIIIKDRETNVGDGSER